MVGINVRRDAAAHVHNAAGIPFLEHLARAGFKKHRGEQRWIVLLDGKRLQAGVVGIYVHDVKAVAMPQFRVVDRLAGRAAPGRTDFHHFINAVVVHVADADLMAPGQIVGGRRREKPAARQLAVAVIKRHALALERAAAVTVFAFHEQARMHTVAIHDAEPAVQRAIAGPHIGERGARQLLSGQPVEDGNVLRRIVGAGDDRTVGQNHAAGGAHRHFRAPVAVEVINRHIVLVADADGRCARLDVVLIGAVVAHVHLPQESAVALVGL